MQLATESVETAVHSLLTLPSVSLLLLRDLHFAKDRKIRKFQVCDLVCLLLASVG
jgi:hypothetical protein